MAVYPQKFIDLTKIDTKELNLVIKFDGISTLFSLMPVYKTFRYGDPFVYGDPSLVYGGLVAVAGVQPIISPNSNLIISQKIEPEQGRGSAGTFSIDFVDVDAFMSAFVTPGQTFDELLGSKQAQFFIGHKNSSYKEDFVCIFRGYVTQVKILPTKITLQFTDANIKRKQQVFYASKFTLNGDITNVATSLTLDKVDGLLRFVTGPDGLYDSSLRMFFRIDNEYLEYNSASTVVGNTVNNISRGLLGTAPAAHTNGTAVTNEFILVGNIVDLALKIMMSGWGGPCLSNIALKSFVNTLDPSIGLVSNAFSLPDGIDADIDYGMTVGDYFTITGSVSNNVTGKITGFNSANGFSNNIVLTNKTFTEEVPTSGVLALRSKYDVFPSQIGNALKTSDVDVNQWETIKSLFAFQTDCTFEFLIKQPESGKDFIEKELLLPAGLYGVTRFGRISVSATKPPLAGANLQTVDINTIIDPQNISIDRGLNTRRYFSEVQFNFDFDYLNDKAGRSLYRLNTNSLVLFDTSSPLPITAKGLRTSRGADTFVDRRAKFILGRYQNAAYEITLKVTFSVALLIEVSDVVVVKDNGTLKLTNLETGLRDLGVKLFEVIDRTIDLKTGTGTLKLISVLNYQVNDRFAGIAPSSLIDTATTTEVRIKDSFGARFPGQEYRKWTEVIGEQIRIHSQDYTYDHTVTLLSFSTSDPFVMQITPALPSAPLTNYVVNLAQYNETSGTNPQSKLLYTFIDHSDTVVSGTSATQFTVANGARYTQGQYIKIHSPDYVRNSQEVLITSIVTNTINCASLGFTPQVGDKVELLYFGDSSGPYRIL